MPIADQAAIIDRNFEAHRIVKQMNDVPADLLALIRVATEIGGVQEVQVLAPLVDRDAANDSRVLAREGDWPLSLTTPVGQTPRRQSFAVLLEVRKDHRPGGLATVPPASNCRSS